MPLLPPPARIVSDGRVAAFGQFAGPIPEPDLERHRPWGPLSGLRLKRWHHLALVHPDVALTFAFVDVGFQRLGWVRAIDRRTGEAKEHAAQSARLDVHVGAALQDDRSHLRTPSIGVEWWANLANGRHHVQVLAPFCSADLELHADAATPLEVVLPVGRGRAMWSHKVPLPAAGRVTVGDRAIELDPAEATAILDLHKAHYPHHTTWRWGTFAGRDAAGARVAMNVTRNIVADPAMHENALWVDGHLSLLDPPEIAVDAEPWRVTGPSLDLRFEGEGERREDLDWGVVASRFRQRHGRWTGRVGEHAVDGAWGLFEDHASAW